MKPRKARAITACWCRCICHTPGMPGTFSGPSTHGTIICAHQTRNGRCPGCIRECNLPRPEDYPK
jgi:hypothetical protein